MKKAVLLCALALSSISLFAGDAAWIRNVDGTWNAATNWNPAVIPNGVGEFAWLTNDISATRTITLDAPIVIGHMTIGDSNDSNNFILNNGTGSLSFATTNAQASLDKRGTRTEVINATITLQNDFKVNIAGPVTLNGTMSESGGPRALLKEGLGLLTMSNVNTASGATIIGGGILHVTITNSLTFGNLQITNGLVEIDIQDLTRTMGSVSNTMQITGGQSGFGANGAGTRTARFGASGSSITWGSTFFNPDVFVLNASNAGRQITIDNAIDMNGQTRRIDVNANIGSISRNITNGLGLVKGGAGTLLLGGANRWSGPTVVTGGALRVDSIGAVPTNNVELHNSVIELSRNLSELYRGLGTGPGEILINGNSGWGAVNAERVFMIGSNTTPLVWSSAGLANLGALVLNWSNSSGIATIANPIDLNGAVRTVTVQTALGRLAGGVTNSSVSPASIVKNGAGTLYVDGPLNAAMTVAAGTLQLGDYWAATGALPGVAGDAGNLAVNASTLLLANPGGVTSTTVLSGVISGTGNMTKGDRRTLQLASTNTYTGTTTLNRGILLLDFGAAGAPASNLIAAGSALTMGNTGYENGTVWVRAAASVTNRQTFRTVTLNASAGRIVAEGGAGALAEISLSNLTRNAGATLDIAVQGSGAVYTSSTNTFGILGGYATFNNTDWAAVETSRLVVAYTGYTDVVSGPIVDASNTNIRAAGSVTIAAPTTTIQTLTITNDGSPVTVDLGGNNLRMGVFGGILVPQGGGSLILGTAANNGLLNSGFSTNTGGTLIFINNSTNPTVVNASVNNNGSGAIGLVKAGAGPLRVNGDARIYGTAYFNGGQTRMSGLSVITNVNLNGGDLWFDATSSNSIGGTITINSGTMTVDGPLIASGAIDVGTIAGGRGAMYISNDVFATRLRGGANDNQRTVAAFFQREGKVFSTAEANGTTISDGLGSYGYYRLSGGSITGNFVGTFRGLAVMDVEGGRLTPSNSFLIVNNTGWGILNVRPGGSVYAPFNGGSTFRFCGNDFGNGVASLNVLGGLVDTATTTNNKALDLATVQGNCAFLNLVGGVLTANQIKVSTTNAVAIVNFNGGTLAAANGTSLGSTFMQGISTAFVYSGGAIIDVNTNSVTIGQSLRAPTDYGLAAIAVNSNSGAGYFAPPLVGISGGIGTGAQAIAELDFLSGAITNFRVTNPGSGYLATDSLTVRLHGGTPTSLPTDFTVSGASLAPNVGGGLFKTGGGTLTLTNANTYSGLTTVRTGILAVTHSSALGTPGAGTTVSNFGRLNISGNVTIADPLWLAGEGDVLNAYYGALRANTGTNTVTGPITLTIPGNTRIRSVAGSRLDVLGGITSGGSNFPLVLNAESGAVMRIATSPIVLATNSLVYVHGGGGRNLWAVNGNIFGTMNLQYSSVLVLETNDAINTNAVLMFGVDSGAGTNAVLDLNGFNQTIAQFRGGTVLDNKRVTNGGTNQSVLSVGNNNASASYNGRIEDGTATLALRKIGTGSMHLQGDNAFTGFTSVDGGTLSLQTNASLASTSILVSAGATLVVTSRVDRSLVLLPGQTLGGQGTVEGAVFSLGEVAPGFSVGLLTVAGSYTQTALGTFTAEIGAAGSCDTLLATDSVGLDGALVVVTNGYAPVSGDTYIIVVAPVVNGTFASATLPALDTGLGWKIDYQTSAVVLSVTGAPSASGYDLWAAAITNGLTNYNESATGDGYPNLLKYATGSSPTNADSLARLSAIRTGGGGLSLLFNRNPAATDVTFVVEGAHAIDHTATWLGIATNVGGSWGAATNVSEVAGTPVAVTVQDPEYGATNRFLRLRVTKP